MDLLALADFNLVARHGGFGRAARAARRPKATLSRRVAELEAALGVRLVERGNRALRLTEEGRLLHERTAALLGEVEEVAAAVGSGSAHPRGLLRISAPLLFGQAAMGRLAAAFVARYPEVSLEVTAEDRSVDMIADGYDLIIRVNPKPTSELVGRCFLRDRIVLAAPPGTALDADGGPVPAVLFSSADPGGPWTVLDSGGPRVVQPRPSLRLSSLVMVRDAVLAGAGLGLLPLSLVHAHVEAGRLRIWEQVDAGQVELWVLHASRRLPSAKVSAFLDFVGQAFPQGTSEELARFLS